MSAGATPVRAQLAYTTLDYPGAPGTFLTGIRGNNIVGNYTVGLNTAGMLYSLSAGTFSPFPMNDGNANYPDAVSSSPYGPSVGNPDGILRTVGSYKTTASSPYDLSYLYDGVAASGSQLTTLHYPSGQNPSSEPTLFTIAHSTFGNQLVGNYDTQLITGNAFLYTISTGAYVNINKPGAVSTTAYGIWGDKIAGGFVASGVGVPQQGFIYDKTTGVYTSYNHPLAISTHFEGITGGGRANTYNLVANWFDVNGDVHASVLHIAANGATTWTDLDKPGATLTSANSIYGNQAIGIYTDSDGTHGYLTSISGIYNPITNSATLTVNTPGTPVLSGAKGDDIVNDGSITTNGANNAAIQSNTYGVVTNNGTITVNGANSAGVEMLGDYGTLLNYGTIVAAAGAQTIRTDASAVGTAVVNTGTLDGQVTMTAGTDVRFENSGWMGIMAAGAGTSHAIAGVFAQTSAGTLGLRLSTSANDSLNVTGVARLSGALQANFQAGTYAPRSYTVLSATGGIIGAFQTVSYNLPNYSVSLTYNANDVALNIAAALGQNQNLPSGLTGVAGGISNSANAGNTLPAGFNTLFGLSGTALASGLGQVSGQPGATGGMQSGTQLTNSFLTLMLNPFGAASGGNPGTSGAARAFGPDASSVSLQAQEAFAAVTPRDAKGSRSDKQWGVWGQGYGGYGKVDGSASAGTADTTTRVWGWATGADRHFGPDTMIGFALAGAETDWGLSSGLGGGKSNVLQTGIYGSQRFGAAYVSGALSYAWYAMSTDRTVTVAGTDRLTANFAAHSFGGRLETGYRNDTPMAAVTPYAALQVQSFHTPAYSETAVAGSGTFALSYDARSSVTTRTEIGAWVEKAVSPAGLVLRARAAWAHDRQSNQDASAAFLTLPGSGFTVGGASRPNDLALLSAGAEIKLASNLLLDAKLDGEFAQGSRTYAGTATLRHVW